MRPLLSSFPPRDSTCVIEALPGKLNIKIHEFGILMHLQIQRDVR